MKDKVVKIVAAVAFVAVGWFGNQVLGPKERPREVADVVDPAVAVGEVRTVEFNPVTEYVGHVEPIQETDILPQIEGYVRKVCFTEGAFVRAGDVLFEIDPEQYEASRKLRYSEVRSAEAKVTVARAEVDRAERYFNRLVSADDRGITATERDTAETSLASAKAALNAALAEVEQAKAAAAIADFNMKHTAVRSPISGRIGKALRHVGDYVSPSKTPLAQVVQVDPIRVVFPITDKDYGAWQAAAERGGRELKDSRRLRLRTADGGEYGKTGVIDFGDNKVDRETATVVMHVSFENAGGALLPDAFVRVLSDESHPPRLMTVPSGAVERKAQGVHVWLYRPDGTVKRAPVEIGATWEGRTVVSKGVEAGARVVVAGGFKLKDGMKVNAVR